MFSFVSLIRHKKPLRTVLIKIGEDRKKTEGRRNMKKGKRKKEGESWLSLVHAS